MYASKMMKIKKFKEFSDYKTIWIFDLDNTLVKSPSFEERAIEYLKEDISIKSLLLKSVKLIGAKISDLKYDDNKVYIMDPDNKYTEVKNWKRKGNRIYLLSPEIYSRTNISLPIGKNDDIYEKYKEVENKCIITARSINMKGKISNRLLELNIELPKYGIHMAPVGVKDAGTWKGEKILEIVNKFNFTKVKFYDDNSKYLKKARKVINTKMPDLDFECIKYPLV